MTNFLDHRCRLAEISTYTIDISHYDETDISLPIGEFMPALPGNVELLMNLKVSYEFFGNFLNDYQVSFGCIYRILIDYNVYYIKMTCQNLLYYCKAMLKIAHMRLALQF